MEISKFDSWFIGDCRKINDFLKNRQSLFWIIPKFANVLLRGVGQVVFANNPFSGGLILGALFWSDLKVGAATTLAAAVSIAIAVIFGQDGSKLEEGLLTYNAVLIGSVTSSIWEPTYSEPFSAKIWGFVILASILSIFVNAGISNVFQSFKKPLPNLTLAFNICNMLLFACLKPEAQIRNTRSKFDRSLSKYCGQTHSHFEDQGIKIGSKLLALEIEEWPAFFEIFLAEGNSPVLNALLKGILNSMGQVYGVEHIPSSLLMYFSTAIYSPIVLMMSFVGASIGSTIGLIFTESPHTSVSQGLWGYNGILAGIAIGGLFFVFNLHSFLAALLNVTFVALIQQALGRATAGISLPIFTFPFVLSSIFFLGASSQSSDKLVHVENIRYPEKHVEEHEKRIITTIRDELPLLYPSAPFEELSKNAATDWDLKEIRSSHFQRREDSHFAQPCPCQICRLGYKSFGHHSTVDMHHYNLPINPYYQTE